MGGIGRKAPSRQAGPSGLQGSAVPFGRMAPSSKNLRTELEENLILGRRTSEYPSRGHHGRGTEGAGRWSGRSRVIRAHGYTSLQWAPRPDTGWGASGA